MSRNISRAAAEQATGMRQVNEAVDRINEMAHQIVRSTKEQRSGSEQITRAAEKMREITRFVRAATTEQVKASKNITVAMDMSDDDILYYPGWLDAELEVFEAFPNVACVSGYPIGTSFRWGCENTVNWMRAAGIFETGRFLPRQYEDDFCVSIGRNPEWHAKNTEKEQDYRCQYNGVYAYATGHHCQFIAQAGKVLPAMRYDDYAMGDEKPFDVALDMIGLRLSTVKRYSRHIGNSIHEELRQEIQELVPC